MFFGSIRVIMSNNYLYTNHIFELAAYCREATDLVGRYREVMGKLEDKLIAFLHLVHAKKSKSLLQESFTD